MDDRFRTSDADRDRVAELLRDHFAAGRLTPEELDERLTATLSARIFGDLRRVLADLPEPAAVRRQASRVPPRVASAWVSGRRGPRLLPLAALALAAALLIPGAGWLFLAFFQAVLLLWLAACLAGIFVAARFYRRMRRDWWSGQGHRSGHSGHSVHSGSSGYSGSSGQGWPGVGSHHQYGYRYP
jgi:uncharacterized membrane protein YgcG